MIWLVCGGLIAVYFVGFFIGRKYERDTIFDRVEAVLAEIDAENDNVSSVTYYYSKDAYQSKIDELKQLESEQESIVKEPLGQEKEDSNE